MRLPVYSFFLSTVNTPGKTLKKGQPGLSLSRVTDICVQLLNAGYQFQKTGVMPEKLSCEHLLETADGDLFLNHEYPINYIEFQAEEFLCTLKQCVLEILTGDTTLPDNKKLHDMMATYPHSFCKGIEKLGQEIRSISYFKSFLNDFYTCASFRRNFMLFEYSPVEFDTHCIHILPDMEVLYPIYQAIPGCSGSLYEIHEPISSYDYFRESFFFLKLPDTLQNTKSVFQAVSENLPEGRTLSFCIHENNLDNPSYQLFKKLCERFPLRFFIISSLPFSEKWINGIETSPVTVFNPVVDNTVTMSASCMPLFDFISHRETIQIKSDNRLIPFLLMFTENMPLKEALETCGLNLSHADYMDRLSDPRFEKATGLSENIVLQRDSLETSSNQLIEDISKADISELEQILEHYRLNPFRTAITETVMQRSCPDTVKGLILYAAEHYEQASEYLKDSLCPDILSESLYWSDRFNDVIDIEQQLSKGNPFAILSRHQLKLNCSEKPGTPLYQAEMHLIKNEFNELAALVNTGKKNDPSLFKYRAVMAAREQNSEHADHFYKKAIEYTEQKNCLFEKAILLKDLGSLFYRSGCLTEARSYFHDSSEIFAALGNTIWFKKCEYNMAAVDLHTGNLESARDYFLNELRESKRENHYKYTVFNLKFLGNIEYFASEFDKASDYYNEAMKIIHAQSIDEEKVPLYYLLASVAISSRDFKQAEKWMSLMKDSDPEHVFIQEALFLNVHMALKMNRTESAQHTLNQLEAIKDRLDTVSRTHLKLLKVLVKKGTLAEAVDLYHTLDSVQMKFFEFSGKTKLLNSIPKLSQFITEQSFKKDIECCRTFNTSFTEVFRTHLNAEYRHLLQTDLFKIIAELLDHAANNELFSFEQKLKIFGNMTGCGDISLTSDSERLEEPFDSRLIRNRKGQVVFQCSCQPDYTLLPVLKMIADASAQLKKQPSRKRPTILDMDCPYLMNIVGTGDAVSTLKKQIKKVAEFPFPVLIQGDSGTGKELTARAIHKCSDRKDRPFIPIHCAALPENLIESELFGHVKGAFTGASQTRRGLLEEAADGTVFLDEIGEISEKIQVKLLRVLQEKEFTRVGELSRRKINARFIFATNRDLRQCVRDHTFREDLFYRISGVEIKNPSLAERREDIPLLADTFLSEYDNSGKKYLSEEAVDYITSLPFKGNIRELQNLIMGAVVHSGDEKEIRPDHFPGCTAPPSIRFTGEMKKATQEFQSQYIRMTLEMNSFNNTRSAEKLGITRQRLIQLRKQYEI